MKRRIQLCAAIAAAAFSCEFAQANLLVQLPSLTTGITPSFQYAYGLSGDGNHIVGVSTTTNSNSPYVATEWTFNPSTQSFSVANLGSLYTGGPTNSKYRSWAGGVNANGSYVVGATDYTNTTYYAALWTTQTNPMTINNLTLSSGSGVSARISEDSQTIVANNQYRTLSGSFAPLPTPSTVITGLPNGYTVADVATTDNVSNVTATGGAIITGLLDVQSGSTFYDQVYSFDTKTNQYTALGTPFAYPSGTNTAGWNESPRSSTPISSDGRFIAGLGTDPAGHEDVFEYDSVNHATTWISATVTGSGKSFTPTAITDDGSFIVGRDDNGPGTLSTATLGNGWIWSSSTGFESIDSFLENTGGYTLSQIDAVLGSGGAADVYGAELTNNVLTLTGLDRDYSGTTGTSYYTEIAVPEPGSLSICIVSVVLSARRKRRNSTIDRLTIRRYADEKLNF